MTNWEYYKEQLKELHEKQPGKAIAIDSSGRMQYCSDLEGCKNCLFYGKVCLFDNSVIPGVFSVLDFMYQDSKAATVYPHLRDTQAIFLEYAVKSGYKYLTRDSEPPYSTCLHKAEPARTPTNIGDESSTAERHIWQSKDHLTFQAGTFKELDSERIYLLQDILDAQK